jgi:RNA 2',3'-cyclic 3'-phosphodiesterase
VALDLPPGPRAELAAWAGARLGSEPGLRLVPEESLHVTLVFLGSVDARRVGEVWEAVARAAEAHAPARLEPRAVAALPQRRPRVLALDMGDEGRAAAGLQEDVAGALVTAGLSEPERRPWRPHVTLARVRRGAEGGVSVPDPPALGPFTASQVTLYRSRPGSDYEALEALELAETGV